MDIETKIKDRYERPTLSLRISITGRCNVNCVYCHHDGILPQKSEMTPNEIYQICKIAKMIGIEKIRLSGGEPLIRKDIVKITEKIASLNFKDISITTNGILLEKYAEDLVKVGLSRVNVSLDTLNPELYKFITRSNNLESVKKGIIAAVKAGLNPVKINMVIMKDLNTNEIDEMFQFCKENNVILQLIELLKTENCDDTDFINKHHFDIHILEEDFENRADKVKVRKFMQGRKKYFIDNGEIEIVKPMDNTKFCENCTRLRITPNGKIKPCLLRNDNLVDIRTAITENKSYEELKQIFLDAINKREPYYKSC